MINISQSFHRTSSNAVDETLTLTKAQMLAVNDNLMPNKYFTVCQDDGAIYLYDKSATPSAETGKFIKFEGGGSDYTAGDGIVIENDEISTNNMSSEDMSEVASPMPSVMSRRFKYSTEEQVVGEWIDGKPLYQKTFTTNTINITTASGALFSGNITIADYIANVDKIFVSIDKSWVNISGVTRGVVSAYQISNELSIFTESSRPNCTITMTVQYTKTTD